jgi:hypothetical protein
MQVPGVIGEDFESGEKNDFADMREFVTATREFCRKGAKD